MRALDESLPNRSIVYFGDHENAPYGNRSSDEIYALTVRGVQRLFEAECSLVIMACNTAAARSLRRLQRDWLPNFYPHRRVLGVIVPVVEEVTGVPWVADQMPVGCSMQAEELQIAVFATQHTVNSRVFVGEISKRAPHLHVWQQACPGLVNLIESDAPGALLQQSVQGYVGDLLARMENQTPDVCILACTHYPLVESLFRQSLPPETRILSQPCVTAQRLGAYLNRHPEFHASGEPSRQFLTTGNPTLASRIATRFYGHAVTFASAD